MRTPRLRHCVPVVLAYALWAAGALAQDYALTKSSEVGFRRLIHLAQTGRFGADVTNANVSVLKDHVRVELVLAGGGTRVLLLRHKDAPQKLSRLFNIDLGEGATAEDAGRVGQALDESFAADPFVVAFDFFGYGAGSNPLPGLAQAWEAGGFGSAVVVLEGRFISPRSKGSTVAVLIALGGGVLACLILLWGSTPARVAAREREPGD